MSKIYKNWTLIDWDGNASLKLKCWRKSFRRGHVSVGAGDFLLICYSFGSDSDFSMSGTRWNYDKEPLTEKEAMKMVDEMKGYATLRDAKELGGYRYSSMQKVREREARSAT